MYSKTIFSDNKSEGYKIQTSCYSHHCYMFFTNFKLQILNTLIVAAFARSGYLDMYIEKLSFHINLTFTQAVSVDLLVNAGLLSWQSELEFGSILFNINEVSLHYCRTMNPA